ncbi:MAG: YigZ family protein [Oscillospiraceae bacterium]
MQPYNTVAAFAECEIQEKKSAFIAAAAFADTEEKAVDFLNSRKVLHRTATHNVYAYVLREGARTRYSDDGEPTKTAGMPVLDVILHAKLTDCVVVVTRYFGGTLLGTGGLVRAYTEAAKAALAKAGTAVITPCVQISIKIDYSLFDIIKQLVDASGAKSEPAQFTDMVLLSFVMPSGSETELLCQLREICRGKEDYTISKPFYTAF